ncbi:DegT/DnrJ/EryC1/StrS family aminotransferase [Marinigracilibium pacificum]|uniref:DegT/DnrJ/EryC1/StrS family aminotransferase n=1 Tax=Marinigracilibium pacificum TaxID=2729599 RepID=A0A848IU26_9BACT|nr:DegT/DnrJ/EryC1/StrS family aminotransferase [Marinigracilibium pacificum]NMM46805.1 DegT/DnrJ/EryC1/StrS family aminotransferase [Marinigracilibium pacificum]
MRQIQMVDLTSQYLRLKKDIDDAIQEVLLSSAFINGQAVKDFANNLSKYLGCKHVIPCGNGTDALQIAMMALGFKPGDEIIVPSFTYVATVEVISLLGLKPVFVEVNKDTFNIDTNDLKDKITSRTVGIVPVHLYGQCANMEELLKIGSENNLKIIEDTAQALGAEYKFSDSSVKKAGTIGDVGTTSFFPSKNLGCFGDGGALMTNNDDLAEYCNMIANHGQKIKYHHDTIGVNSRLDTLQAAILNVKLKELDDFAKRRNEVANKYNSAFENNSFIKTPNISPSSTHVYHQYTITLSKEIDRDKLKSSLAKKGVPTMVYYPIPVHLQKAYLKYGYKKGDFPISESLCHHVISLPIHTEMNEGDQQFIIDTFLNEISKNV